MKKKERILRMLLAAVLAVSFFAGLLVCGTKTDVYAKKKISLNKTNITMLRYHSYRLKVKGSKKHVAWSTENENLATIDEQGNITALNEGKVVITAKVGKKTLNCKVKIIDPNPKVVLAAYGYQGLKKALPQNAELKVEHMLTGTSLQNKDMAYFDCTFKDKIGREIHAYIEVYCDFGESMSYHTVKTQFYQDNVILHFHERPLDDFSLSKCKKTSAKEIKNIAKKLSKLEKITVIKGEKFDGAHEWLTI